jgi:hypothetical protein
MAVLGLFLLLCTGPVQAQGWSTFSPPGGNFSVQMPGTPTSQQSVEHSPVGNVPTWQFILNAGGWSYAVAYSDLPQVAVLLGGAGSIFDEAKQSLLQQANATPVSYFDTTTSGKPAKSLTFTVPGGGQGQALLVLDGTRLYVVAATPLSASAPAADASSFISSFRLQ